MNPRTDFLPKLQELARQVDKWGDQYGPGWKKEIEQRLGIKVKSLTSFLRRAKLGTIKRSPSFEGSLRTLIPSDAAAMAADMQRQWPHPFQALDEADLKPKERAIWRKLLIRIVTLAESDPAWSAYLSQVIAGREAQMKATARRKRRRS